MLSIPTTTVRTAMPVLTLRGLVRGLRPIKAHSPFQKAGQTPKHHDDDDGGGDGSGDDDGGTYC